MMYQQVKTYRQAGRYWLIHTEHVVAHQLLRGKLFSCHGPKDTRIMISHKKHRVYTSPDCVTGQKQRLVQRFVAPEDVLWDMQEKMAFSKSSELLAKSKHLLNSFSRGFFKHKKRRSPSRDPEERANNDGAGHHRDQTARPGSLPSTTNIAADQPCESTHATSQTAVDTTVCARNVENEDPSSTTSECPAETVTECLWQIAFNQLEVREKKSITKHLSPSSNESQRDELLRMVQEKEAEYKGRSIVITVDNKDLTWSAYGPVVISHLVTIGEIAIKFAPSPASPIWSAFKVLLSVFQPTAPSSVLRGETD